MKCWQTLSNRWQALSPRARGSLLLSVGFGMLLLAIAVSNTGCAAVGGAFRALSKDTNSMSFEVSTTFGSVKYHRNGNP